MLFWVIRSSSLLVDDGKTMSYPQQDCVIWLILFRTLWIFPQAHMENQESNSQFMSRHKRNTDFLIYEFNAGKYIVTLLILKPHFAAYSTVYSGTHINFNRKLNGRIVFGVVT